MLLGWIQAYVGTAAEEYTGLAEMPRDKISEVPSEESESGEEAEKEEKEEEAMEEEPEKKPEEPEEDDVDQDLKLIEELRARIRRLKIIKKKHNADKKSRLMRKKSIISELKLDKM